MQGIIKIIKVLILALFFGLAFLWLASTVLINDFDDIGYVLLIGIFGVIVGLVFGIHLFYKKKI